ncbi:MAG: BTAD domain-containing putative transcriptional regulator [Caldilineaceae bacterium]
MTTRNLPSFTRVSFSPTFSYRTVKLGNSGQNGCVKPIVNKSIRPICKWAATLEVGGQWSDALAVTRRLLTHAPWHEEAHCTLMRLLARSGQRSAALAHYDTLTQILLDELGVPPAPTTNALYDQILAGALRRRRAHWHLSKKVRILSCLDPLPVQDLFGTERARERIYNVLQQTDRPWLVVLDGIGGIGKTTLATLLVHDFVKSERFAAIAWVSAKQEEFRPTGGLATTGRPALDEATLTNTLLEQLTEQPPLSASNQEKQQLLYQLLHERSMLVIVDNLESVADYQALVPYLRQLANPSKFLITSRYTLQSYSDVYCYSLTELEASDALAFLRHEAATRNNSRLADATDAQLEMIYAVVGGNPLALKLVIGQLTFLPLAQVLSNLREARGKRIDQLYTYIYWQAWQMLTEPSRQLLLSLPVVPNGTFAQLALASELDIEDLQEALAQLHALSLVQTGGDLDEPRYPLHRLTETFLMQEVLSWQ